MSAGDGTNFSQNWINRLTNPNLRPSLYTDGWKESPRQIILENWRKYSEWYQKLLLTLFGEDLEVPDWRMEKVFSGKVGSLYGFKVLQSNRTIPTGYGQTISIPRYITTNNSVGITNAIGVDSSGEGGEG